MIKRISSRFYKDARKLPAAQYLYIIFPILIVSVLILLIFLKLLVGGFETLDQGGIKFSGRIKPNLSKAYEFNYQKGEISNLFIKPSWQPESNISILVYHPDKSVEEFDFTKLSPEKTILLSKAKTGKYRLSIRNNGTSVINYSLEITLNETSSQASIK